MWCTVMAAGSAGLFKAISTVDQTGEDEPVKASIDGGINLFDTANNHTECVRAKRFSSKP